MNNFLLMLGALLVGILAALAIVPTIVDWNSYRGVFEEEATRLMGRDVRVAGAVNLRILPVPFVRFEKLRIADLNSTGGDPLFRADSVTMQLSLPPLLRGVLEAKSVELKHPQLRLAVDSDGRGNWRSLNLTPGSLPFVPADVALQSVGIDGGTLVLAGQNGKDLVQLDDIAGELSADSIEGPYKFKGTAKWDGESRELKASTAKPDSDGATHLRASIRALASDNSYLFDGRILDVKDRPRIDGELTAKLKLAPNVVGAKGATGDADSNTLDFKAKVGGDLKSAELSGIELSRDDPIDPQLVTGSAKAVWGDTLRVDMAMASRSVNLDKLTPASAAGDPMETARNGLAMVLAVLPAEADTEASFKADRVTLQGEPLTGVSVAIRRRGEKLEVTALKALLPGATRLLASGYLTKDPKQPAFSGPISLKGTNLARFLAWSRKSPGQVSAAPNAAGGARYDGPFALEGRLEMTGGRVELTQATAELAGQAIVGELRMSTEGRRRVGVVLEGERIDAARLWPGGFDPMRLRALLLGDRQEEKATHAQASPSNSAGSDPGLYGFDAASTDVTVEVRASQFQLTTANLLRNVDTNFSVTKGQLTVPRLRFTTQTGLVVNIDGEMSGLSGSAAPATTKSQHQGTVRFAFDAATPAAVLELLNAVDWPTGGKPSDEQLKAFAALGAAHLAGSTVLAERGGNGVDITVDGAIDGGRVTAHARLDDGINSWSTAPLSLAGSVETADIDRWLALAGIKNRSGDGDGVPASNAGRLNIQSEGPSARTGLTTLVALASDRLSLIYQGRVALPTDADVEIDGSASVAARDAYDVASLAGLNIGRGPSQRPFSGTVHIIKTTDGLAFSTSDGKLGTAGFNGVASLKAKPTASGAGKPAPRDVSAQLSFDVVSLSDLMAAISDRRHLSEAQTVWPSQPLVLTDALTGHIDLTAGQLVIDGPAALQDAAATVTIGPGTLAIDGLTGHSAGGTVKGRLELTSSSAGAALTGEMELGGANLAVIAPGATGPLAVAVTIKGQGLSASGLVASLTGTGEATLGAGQIKGVAPGAVATTIETALASKQPLAGDDLTNALRRALAASNLAFGPRKVPIMLADGTLRLRGVPFPAPEGRALLDASLDLTQLTTQTRWQIEAAAKPSSSGVLKPPLPAVVVAGSGTLANLQGDGERVLTLTAFEQELVLRKIEHDAQELERLRKLDEERRLKEETDRLKAAEAAKAATATQGDGQTTPGAVVGTDMPSEAAATSSEATAVPPGTVAPPTPSSGLTRAPTQATRPRPSQGPRQDGIPQPFTNTF